MFLSQNHSYLPPCFRSVDADGSRVRVVGDVLRQVTFYDRSRFLRGFLKVRRREFGERLDLKSRGADETRELVCFISSVCGCGALRWGQAGSGGVRPGRARSSEALLPHATKMKKNMTKEKQRKKK